MKFRDQDRELPFRVITKMNRLWEQTKTSLENKNYDLARMQITILDIEMMKIIDEEEKREQREDIKKQKKMSKNNETQDLNNKVIQHGENGAS
jgi:predicted nucleotidyltransferase